MNSRGEGTGKRKPLGHPPAALHVGSCSVIRKKSLNKKTRKQPAIEYKQKPKSLMVIKLLITQKVKSIVEEMKDSKTRISLYPEGKSIENV